MDQVTPIAGCIQTELMLLTTPESPWTGLADLVAAAEAERRRRRVTGGASDGNDHIATGLIETAAGITLTCIPHESGGAARATFLCADVGLHFATLQRGWSR